MITVQNIGDLTLNITGTNILLNGSMMNVTQRGVNPSIWLPGTIVNFTVQGNIQLSTNDEVFLTVIVITDSLNPTQGVYTFTEVVRIV
jgi:archaellum component FlaF (FlaF/FlaG flagellin family)